MTDATIPANMELPPVRPEEKSLPVWKRVLLLAGLVWALLVIVPDFYRLSGSLAQFGFSADNSGVIYEPDTGELQDGDRILLSPGACWSPSSDRCRDFLAVFGGMGGLSYVLQDTTIKLRVVRGNSNPLDIIESAQPAYLDPATKFFLALDEIAGVIMIWLAFKLVWDHPSRMTMGFFLYAMWFNPGQYFAFYAWLQQYPAWFLAQEALQAIAQGAGYAGFLIFALRFPHNRTEHELRGLEPLALGLGATLAILQLASFASAFGIATDYTEWITRCAIFGGYTVSLSTILVVLYRLPRLPPLEHQRMRWVLWGCLVGIPAFIFADSNEATSFWAEYVWNLSIWHGWMPNEPVLESGYLLCGILAICIWTAVRHPRVLNITPQLIAFGVTAVLFILGYRLEDDFRDSFTKILNLIGVPDRAQFLASMLPLALLSYGTHKTTLATDHVFNRRFHRASTQLEALGKNVRQANGIGDIDAALVNGPCDGLNLASAATFRKVDGRLQLTFRSQRWNASLSELNPDILQRVMEKVSRGDTKVVRVAADDDDEFADVAAPAVAVPVVFADELHAVALYGAHVNGADIDHLEVGLLEDFAARIALAYEKYSKRTIQEELQALRQQLAEISKPQTV
jgi:hypothetical protein